MTFDPDDSTQFRHGNHQAQYILLPVIETPTRGKRVNMKLRQGLVYVALLLSRACSTDVSRLPRSRSSRRRLAAISNVAEINDHGRRKATPVFWHVPKAGGTTVHDLVADCLHYIVAAEVGILGGHDDDTELETVHVDGRNYVNVDTTTIPGILHAQQLGFANVQPADVVFTSYLHESTTALFTPDHPAALFTLLRHPVDRAVSLFYYLQDAYWEKRYYHPEWANMTIMAFAQSDFAERNWMVGFLVGKSYVTADDVEEAKAVLSKMIIGFDIKMKDSLQRFGMSFGWNEHHDWDYCINRLVSHGSNQHKHPHVEHDSPEWKTLLEINKLDMEIYYYAEQLYEEQGHSYFADNE